MDVHQFTYPLPEDLIAQRPLSRRDGARMMVLDRKTQSWEHRRFADLPDIVGSEHFLVVNNSRVIPARLWAHRPGKEERIEIFLYRRVAQGAWLALVRPSKKVRTGSRLRVDDLEVRVLESIGDGRWRLGFHSEGCSEDSVTRRLEQLAATPLPPYIRRSPGEDLSQDTKRYQTIFAREPGSVAAPTAGLHFTRSVVQRLRTRGVSICEILLHVGLGTFASVRARNIEDHRIEPEYCEVSAASARCIDRQINKGRSLVAVGTTTTRALEHLVRQGRFPRQPDSGWCDLSIYPGFRFEAVQGLLTNFHLPESTLLMLVCAFAGYELTMSCYREAISSRYRFYSYGDCMLIL